MASLPPALNAFIIARQYDTWVEASSTTVLVGTMVSVLTLTTIMWLLGTGQLPIYP
jgi:malonate transporter